jgi:membrane fusion protein (multidrug efflux system)
MSTENTTNRGRRGAAAAIAAIVLVTGAGWWLHARRFESTDDAQVDGHVHAISARVTGTVVQINPDVLNDRYVAAGTLLLELDPNDADTAVEQAKAFVLAKEAAAAGAAAQVVVVEGSTSSRLERARAAEAEALQNVSAEQASLEAACHRVERDQIVADRTERDRARYAALVEKHEISRSEYDVRDADAKSAAVTLDADRAEVDAAERRVAQAQSRVGQRRADLTAARTAPDQVSDARAKAAGADAAVAQARADFHAAELTAGYTKIYAPVGGIIGHKTVEIGHRVQPGQTLLMIVPVEDLWVTANFKETQLRTMHPGQPVDIHVDAFDRDYHGTIDDLAGAAGTVFSLLPPENASGNFVKVVQRLPVRIRLEASSDPDHRLRPGMSVEARVRVQ